MAAQVVPRPAKIGRRIAQPNEACPVIAQELPRLMAKSSTNTSLPGEGNDFPPGE